MALTSLCVATLAALCLVARGDGDVSEATLLFDDGPELGRVFDGIGGLSGGGVGFTVHTDRQTDRQTDGRTELNYYID